MAMILIARFAVLIPPRAEDTLNGHRVKPLDDKLGEKQGVLSISFLMNRGLNFILEGDYDSASILLERLD